MNSTNQISSSNLKYFHKHTKDFTLTNSLKCIVPRVYEIESLKMTVGVVVFLVFIKHFLDFKFLVLLQGKLLNYLSFKISVARECDFRPFR